jgi:hypothetical protein
MDSSSYFQSFGKRVDQYQGLQPHSDGYKMLEQSWLSYVCHERRVAGIESPLPVAGNAKRRTRAGAKVTNSFQRTLRFLPCSCGKSGTSYPHWPPSCHEEALDQLRCILEAYPHRLHLAHGWQSFLWREQCRRKSETPELEEYVELASLLRNSCPTLFPDDDNPDEGLKRKFDCKSFGCERVIREKLSFCLCCCFRHREECPVHRF